MHRSIRRRAFAAMLLLPLAAVGARAIGPKPRPRELFVTASDFAFRAPDTVAAGFTRIRLRNDGAEMHFLQLLRLADGRTIAELRDGVAAKEYIPSWTVPVGGPGVPPPGGTSEVVADLAPGRYALVCFIASPDGASHAMKGMIREMVVVPSPNGMSVAPDADVRITLHDYAFELSTPLRAGRHVVRVENGAEQPHEVGLFHLAPGRTFDDVMAWERTHTGPPPFTPAGGALSLARGQVNYVTLDLLPGDYVLFCFVPDAKDHKPHIAHGMVRQIRVD